MNKSQLNDILEHLKKQKKITSMEAFEEYHITRLSSIIYILRSKGFDIRTEISNSKNEYGHLTQYAIYHLENDGDAK